MDLGKRGILEYDYYIDHTDQVEKARIGRAMVEIDPWLDRMAEKNQRAHLAEVRLLAGMLAKGGLPLPGLKDRSRKKIQAVPGPGQKERPARAGSSSPAGRDSSGAILPPPC